MINITILYNIRISCSYLDNKFFQIILTYNKCDPYFRSFEMICVPKKNVKNNKKIEKETKIK